MQSGKLEKFFPTKYKEEPKMKNDALNRFKEEMNRRGLIRKIQVCANLIPPRLMLTRNP